MSESAKPSEQTADHAGESEGPHVLDAAIDETGKEVVQSLAHELAAALRESFGGEFPHERVREMMEDYGEGFFAMIGAVPIRMDAELRVTLLRRVIDESPDSSLAAWAVAGALGRFERPDELHEELGVFRHYVDAFGDRAVEPLMHHLRHHGDPAEEPVVDWLAENAPERLRLWGRRLFTASTDEAFWGALALRSLGESGREVLLDFLGASKADIRLRALDALMEDPGGDLREPMRAQLGVDRSRRVRDALRLALFELELLDRPPLSEPEPTAAWHAELDELLSSYPLSLPKDLDADALPSLRWSSGAELSPEAQQWVLGRLARAERDDSLAAVTDHLEQGSQMQLLEALRAQYGDESTERRIGWVLYATAVLGDDDAMTDFGRGLDRLASSNWAEAAHRLTVMQRHGGPAAIQWIDRWARTAKRRSLRDRAVEALDEMAHEAGLSRDELTEKAMDDFGFDPQGRQQIPWATRGTMTIRLGPSNELTLIDESGKVWDRYPGVLKADDPDDVARAKASVSNLKKQVKLATRGQIARMERAMIVGRTWTEEEFGDYLENPLIANLARHLLWGTFGAGEMVAGFRVAPDRSFADVDDELFEVGGSDIRLVHPLHLDEATLRRWSEVFVDYELIPVFEQLEREVFVPSSEELDETAITRFEDQRVDADRLRYHFERRNWIRSDVRDTGLISSFTRPFPAQEVTAVAWVEPGFAVIRGDWNEPQAVSRITFVQGIQRNPSWTGEGRLTISEIERILFSEVLFDVAQLVGEAKS